MAQGPDLPVAGSGAAGHLYPVDSAQFSSPVFGSPGYSEASQVAIVVKSLPANAGELRDAGSSPG